MMIRGLEDAFQFRASVLAEKYGIPIDKARLLKGGGIVDVGADKTQRLIESSLAEQLDQVANPVAGIEDKDNNNDKDKEDL